MKDLLKIIIKIFIASGLIYWLIDSGKLSFTELSLAMRYPTFPIIALFVFIFVFYISAIRWKMILVKKSKLYIKTVKVFLCNWIGSFFNIVVPGSVSGDIIKIFYLKDSYPDFSKKFLLFSVFIDRLMGLFALVTLGAIAGSINYISLDNINNELLALILFNIVIVFCILFFFLFLFIDPKWMHHLSGKISPKIQNYWSQAINFKAKLFYMYLLSFIIQGLVVFIFWFVTKDYSSSPLSLYDAYTIIPFGFIIMAIPIAPAGIGVGHFAYQELFSFIGITNGASLFNIYFCVFILAHLTGLIPYVSFRKKQIMQK